MSLLRSGEHYNLKEIFSGKNRIEIPDMQRDYCWAKTISITNGKNLVENFINDLIQYIDIAEDLQMGLLYAYESPQNHIQLCDGQQRITTLYLALGVLNYHSNIPEIRNLLIIEDEISMLPRLQYSIRETTLSFLNDVVQSYFLNSNEKSIKLNSLKEQNWYFHEYNNDPSIQNILIAIEYLSEKFTELIEKDSSFPEKFLKLLINKINFLYFDMVNRTYGEEQFVVLNTTGKPLSVTENIKPKLLGDLNDIAIFKNSKTKLRYYSDLWENWEMFFWENKNDIHQTADIGLNEFFRWIYIIEKTDILSTINSASFEYNSAQKALSSFKYNIIEIISDVEKLLDEVEIYFISLKILLEDPYIKKKFLFKKEPLTQIQSFELLSLLCFVKEFNIMDINDRNYIRLKNFLIRRSQDINVSKSSITTTLETIRIVKILKQNNSPNLLDMIQFENNISAVLINECEVYKFKVLNNRINNQQDIENAFWQAEQLNSCAGNIEILFKALNINYNDFVNVFPLDNFKKLFKIITNTFETNTDLMRRALLTFGHSYIWDGNTVTLNSNRYSLGNAPNFYGNILFYKNEESKLIILQFLKSAFNEIQIVELQNIEAWYINLINKFKNSDFDIYSLTRNQLITDEKFIDSMADNLFCVQDDKLKSFALFGKKAIGEGSYSEIASHP